MVKTPKKGGKPTKKPTGVVRGALFFGMGTLSSRIFGLIRDALILSYMPLDVKDAWFAALRVPNVFRRLLGEGGLSASFVPIFVESREVESPADVRNLINGVFTLLFGFSALLCFVAIIFMPGLARLILGEGFLSVPGKMEMTISMARITFGFLFFITLFAYFMALLNGVKRFALTGFAPLILNLSIIGFLWWGEASEDIGTWAAFGFLVGGALQALVLVPAVVRSGLFPKLSWLATGHRLVRKVLSRFFPALLGIGVVQLMSVINLAFASRLPSGALTYMATADRLLELPLSLIGVSLGTALLPTLSGYWANSQNGFFAQSLVRHIRLFLFLGIPAAGGLWFFGEHIVTVLFVRGQFTQSEVPLVGQILKVYGLTLVSAGSLRIFNQGFYASQDTLTPAKISAFGLVIHCLMAPFWMDHWGVVGLCFSTALTTFVNLKISSLVAHRRFGLPGKRLFLVSFLKTAVATAAMCTFLHQAAQLNFQEGPFVVRLLTLLGVVGFGAAIYFLVAFILKNEDMNFIRQRLRHRKT